MKVILDKEAVNVAHATATPSQGRPILEQVYINDGTITVCDEVMLVQHPVTIEGDNIKPLLINGRALLEARRLLEADTLVLETQGQDKVTITTTKQDPHSLSIGISLPLYHGTYPAFAHITKVNTPRKAYVALQSSVIAKILKVTPTQDSQGVRIKVREATEPVEIHINDTDLWVMPYAMPEEEPIESPKEEQ